MSAAKTPGEVLRDALYGALFGSGEPNADGTLSPDKRISTPARIAYESAAAAVIAHHEASQWRPMSKKPDGISHPRSAGRRPMIHSTLVDEFFDDAAEALEWVADREIDELPDALRAHGLSDYEVLAALQLTECAPNIASVRPDQFSCLMSPDDHSDMPPEIEAACDAFNEAVKDVVLSWHATSKPLDISAYKEGA